MFKNKIKNESGDKPDAANNAFKSKKPLSEKMLGLGVLIFAGGGITSTVASHVFSNQTISEISMVVAIIGLAIAAVGEQKQ